MNKSSTSYLFECYIWLVNTIARGPITRAAIDDMWARASVNDYKTDSIPECTFHRWRNNAELLFDVTIKCNTHGEYYIEDGNNLHSDDWRNRMFQLFAMNSLIKDSKELRHRILHEHVPSGEKYLTTVVEAMRDGCVLEMTYQGFAKTEPSTFMVEPYCLKMFKQRWYMLAHSVGKDKTLIYSLDRIHALEPTTRKYQLPKDFDAEFYFRNTYGVCLTVALIVAVGKAVTELEVSTVGNRLTVGCLNGIVTSSARKCANMVPKCRSWLPHGFATSSFKKPNVYLKCIIQNNLLWKQKQ